MGQKCNKYAKKGREIDYWMGDTIEGSYCPKCGGRLEYNGNYFHKSQEDACGYVMPDVEDMTLDDKDAFNIAYVMLMLQRGKQPNLNSLFPEGVQPRRQTLEERQECYDGEHQACTGCACWCHKDP